jgi:hypothetical protein
MRRRWRHFVVDCSPVGVAAQDFEARGRRILKILHHPHTPALVEVDKHRLAHNRLG